MLNPPDINDGELKCAPHLLGGEPDAAGIVHRVKHIRDQLCDFRGNLINARALLAQRRMSIFDDR